MCGRPLNNDMNDETPNPVPPKAGYKTTEFWLSAAVTLIGLLAASGVIPVDSPWAKAIGFASAALAAMGYTASRGAVKSP